MSSSDEDHRATSNDLEQEEINRNETLSDRITETINEQQQESATSPSIETNVETNQTEINLNKTVIAEASFTDEAPIDQQSDVKRPSVARILVKPGQIFRVQVNNQVEEIRGPATVRMISENRPNFPLSLHLPPGHILKQILDENGVITHVIVSQTGPLPPLPPPLPHHLHTSYSSPPYYGHPHPYHNAMVYGTYLSEPLPYNAHSMAPQSFYHVNDSNNLPNNTNPTSMTTNSTNHHHHHHQQRRSPVYNNSSCSSGTGASHQRNSNSGTTKRRNTGSHVHMSSHVNNATINGSNKASNHQHYSTFQPEMNNQYSTDSNEPSATIEFDNEQQIIEPSLLKLSIPNISNITSRTALVQIQPPDIVSCAGDQSINVAYPIYELWLSDKGRDGNYKRVFRDDFTEIVLKDLRPATEFHLKALATIGGCVGEPTNPVSFTTDCCEPECPAPPKLLGGRQKTSLNLKWGATTDNGSKITNYILECDEGSGNEFSEIFRGTKKQFNLTKLKPATSYTFRLAAENSFGRSQYSPSVQFSTLGTIPPDPEPPVAVESSSNSITLSWTKRPTDENFTLQICDGSNHFQNEYTGTATSHTITKLFRNTEYRFRLASHNQSGQSNFSQTVTVQTLPTRPDPPGKPRLKGQIQATQCRIAWDPPKENGGGEVQQYHVELEESKGFHVIHNCSETEYLLEQLIPGHSYSFRVSCSNTVGRSDPSPVTQIKTPAVAPASCHSPKVLGKPKSNSLTLRWTYPDYDGGSPVTEFEVQIINPDNSSRLVYRGRELECVVAGLSPGQLYQFQTRAFNRAGAGPWSDFLEVLSGPGLPEAPKNLTVQCRSSTCAFISWQNGANNGAPIHEYRLEWSRKENESFVQLYCGPNSNYEVKGLSAMTHYFFRAQAVTVAGSSPFSIVASCVTPAGVPCIVTGVKIQTKSTSMLITWKEPHNNGSTIIGYHIDIGEKEFIFVAPEAIEYTVDEVLPDTSYKVRLRAINIIGHGPFSSIIKCQTKCLPPDAPRLECTSVTCNTIKVKWTTTNSSSNSVSNESNSTRSIIYGLEMKNKDESFNCIYSGNLQTFKVNKLQENTDYFFRINAKNDAGSSPWSNIESFRTAKAPPNALKAPQISEITSNSCVFHWQTHRQMADDPIHYVLQFQVYRKDNEYTEVYRGPSTSFRVENLQSGVDYRARVYAIRLTVEGPTLNSPYSPAAQLALPRPEEILANLSKSVNVERRENNFSVFQRIRSSAHRKLKSFKIFESRTLTDQQWAFVISVAFALLAIFIAIFANVIYSKYNSSPIDNSVSSTSA